VPAYTRRQLVVLLGLVIVAGGGLAIDHWRAHHPDLVERLERMDRNPGGPAAWPSARPANALPGAGPSPASARAQPRQPRPGALARTGPEPPPRPRKLHDPPTGEPPPGPLDLNRASVDDLARLPGVGPALASRIAEARAAAGGFASVDDLRRVRGVGPATLDRLRPYVAVTP
jgi:competence protein ComEA